VSADLRLGRWEDVLADVGECDPETHAKGLRRLAGVTLPLPGMPLPDRFKDGGEQLDLLRGEET